LRCKRRRTICYYRRKLVALAITAPIVIASATSAKAWSSYDLLLPLQKEANHEINVTLQSKSIPAVLTCFQVLELLTVLAGAGVLARTSYRFISEFLVSSSQVRVQENLSEHNPNGIEETKG